jgi:hypothetical protein
MIRSQRQQMVDETMDAYVAWREECARVWDAYRRSLSTVRADAAGAFPAYFAALDREERASEVYADLLTRLNHQAGRPPSQTNEHDAPTPQASQQ